MIGIKEDAAEFRKKKIEEFLEKSSKGENEVDEAIIKQWIIHYGKRVN